MSNAYQSFAARTAELDFNEQRLRRMLAQRLMLSKEQREESLLSARESDSARGLLNSSSALKNQTDTSTDYDRADAAAQQTADDELSGISRSRSQASADYLAAKAEEERAAAAATPLLQEVDPTDPLGWKKIAEEMKASGDPTFQDGYVNSDPHGWAAIAAGEAAAGNPDYVGMANTALTPPSMRRSPARTPRRSVNPVNRPTTTAIFG